MDSAPQSLLVLTTDELRRWLAEHKEPPYRLGQILEWVYRRFAASFDEMSDLPAPLREQLREAFILGELREIEQSVSTEGSTVKSLFALRDGELIESVAMKKERERLTFCISSQAGCALGCSFCATGAIGLRRNLTLGEVLGQVHAMARSSGGLRNVVFMGMGEPLHNLETTLAALAALADPKRFVLGARHITVSTAGVTPGIRRLAESPVKPNLALSLNSPYDGQRSELMPINRKHPLAEVLQACDEYAARAGRRLLLEYVLLGGVNTSAEAARAVGKIAQNLRAIVNLIPFNPVPGCGHRPPRPREVSDFNRILEGMGIRVTQRFRRGREIHAGCGQLAARRTD